MIEWISALAIPLLLCGMALVLLILARQKSNLFDEFLSGAKEGMMTSVRLLPTLVALLTAVSMLRASGFLEWLAACLSPYTARMGLPAELLPLLLIRPVSGSGSNAILIDLFEQYGADSLVGLCASVLVGSSDTLVYIIAVYFSAVGVQRTRHALPAALLTSLVCLSLSLLVCRLFFGEGCYG
jgi:spore maturation protein B